MFYPLFVFLAFVANAVVLRGVQKHDAKSLTWKTDGSSAFTTLDNVVIQQEGSTGSPHNILWPSGLSPSEPLRYWEVYFPSLSSGASVGLTTENRFGAGYNMTAMMYNGNLSNAKRLLVGQFGPRLQSGSIVGMWAQREDGKLRVYFELDDESLGLAFEIDESLVNGVLFPVVGFSGSGAAVITEVDTPSSPSPRLSTAFGSTYAGTWRLNPSSLRCNSPTEIPVPTEDRALATLTIEADSDDLDFAPKYKVHMKVVNSMNFSLSQKDGKWVTGPQMATKMAGPPQLMAIENCLNDIFKDPEIMELDFESTNLDDRLNLKKGKAVAVFDRFEAIPQPFKGNPFE